MDEVQMTCPMCGIGYCLPTRFQAERREDHKSWYCPNGHSLHYPGKTEQEKRIEHLEGQLEHATQRHRFYESRIDGLEHEVRSLRSKLAWAKRRAA